MVPSSQAALTRDECEALLGISERSSFADLMAVCETHDITWTVTRFESGWSQAAVEPSWGFGCGDESAAFQQPSPRVALYEALVSLAALHGRSLVEDR